MRANSFQTFSSIYILYSKAARKKDMGEEGCVQPLLSQSTIILHTEFSLEDCI